MRRKSPTQSLLAAAIDYCKLQRTITAMTGRILRCTEYEKGDYQNPGQPRCDLEGEDGELCDGCQRRVDTRSTLSHLRRQRSLAKQRMMRWSLEVPHA